MLLKSTVRARAKDLIRHHEGFRDEPYKDSLGFWTAGVGHLIRDSDPPLDDPCWRDPGFLDRLYDLDFAEHLNIAPTFVGRDCFEALPEDAQVVLIDMAFNLGVEKLAKFRRLRAGIQAGDFQLAARSMRESRWFEQVGRRGERLVGMMESLA